MRKTLKIPGIDQCPVDDIVSIEGKGNYTTIFLKNGETILMAKTLKKFESQLRLGTFLRIHKSYLVNKVNVIGHDLEDTKTVKTILQHSLPVSRRKLDLVRGQLAKFFFHKKRASIFIEALFCILCGLVSLRSH
jgi:DNA-binding LytR/AlgR family response regulator